MGSGRDTIQLGDQVCQVQRPDQREVSGLRGEEDFLLVVCWREDGIVSTWDLFLGRR